MSAPIQAQKALNAHIWNRGDNDWYIEPSWCSERLFAEEKFKAPIWDPCCGLGTIPEAAIGAGLEAVGTDIVNRGYVGLSDTVDFLSCTFGRCPNIVCSPPFNIVKAFALHALSLADKVAMVCPTARLNAARWLQGTPLMRVWLMTPRPSMPPGHVIRNGGKASGGKTDFCWLVWSKDHTGPAELRWLQRGVPRNENWPDIHDHTSQLADAGIITDDAEVYA
jgi:hypothetical protein